MIKKVIWVLISCLMVLSLVLASCGKVEEEEEVTPSPEEEEEVTPPPEEEEEVTPPPTGGNWWDKFGEPQYGGMITIAGTIPKTFDPLGSYTTGSLSSNGFFDQLFIWDWTVDRNEYPFKTFVVPIKYNRGMLVESWEWTDPQTLILNIRQNVYYQNKPPANGRKLTAYDIQYHFDRALGTGSGFTQPNPGAVSQFSAVDKVTALDNYTVQAKYKTQSLINNWNAVANPGSQNEIENPETVNQYGPIINDWRYAVGTGPFILKDYVPSSSMTLSRNPNYWGYDERYPEAQLPYVDQFRMLEITDLSTRMAAMRTGKIDMMTGVSWERAPELLKSNPELLQAKMGGNAGALEMRVDNAPFNDIRVRKALQLAIDRETIAKTYYGGVVDGKPCAFLSPYTKGYCYDYNDWPQELKDQYSYNPELAKKLLAEAGYLNGFKTNCLIATGGEGVEVLQIIQSYFKAINVDMEIRQMDSLALFSYISAGKQDQMVSRGWWGMPAPVDVPIMTLFWSKGPPTTTRASNADFDALVDQWRKVQDEAEAQRISREAQKVALENHWVISMFPLTSFNLWEPYLKGYSGEMLSVHQQYMYWARFWIDQDLKKAMGY